MPKAKKPPADTTRLIGYARVSTREQNLQMQIDALKRVGVLDDNLWVEKVSGVSARRPQRDLALLDARDGDTFVVWRLDRLGRSVSDLYRQVETMRDRGVKFRSLTDNVDTSTTTGKLMFGIFAVLAEFERNQTIERTLAGMASARARGRMPGRAPKMTAKKLEQAANLIKVGWSIAEIAKRFKVSDNALYRYFPAAELERLRDPGRDDK
jgi:DNA invertase Pin-like site-specific DNA recombinase